MDSKPISWLQGSPFRSPAWRWHRANWLVERGKRCSRKADDVWVARAKSYITAQSRNGSSPTGVGTSKRDFPVGLATKIWCESHRASRELNPACGSATTIETTLTVFLPIRSRGVAARAWVVTNGLHPFPLPEMQERELG